MKNLFVTTVAALALATSSTLTATTAKSVVGKKQYVVLWNQNSNFGGSVNSQIYESSMGKYDDYAADDFVVPDGQKWIISEVDVTGYYTNGSGPASSVLVSFCSNKNGLPFRVAQSRRDYFTLNCTDNAGSFQCVLPTKGPHNEPVVMLRQGTYWVSVSANCDSQTCGQWNWTENTTVTSNQAVWENPSGAWNILDCHGWNELSTCFGGAGAARMSRRRRVGDTQSAGDTLAGPRRCSDYAAQVPKRA